MVEFGAGSHFESVMTDLKSCLSDAWKQGGLRAGFTMLAFIRKCNALMICGV